MRFHRHIPAAPLRDFVQDFWLYEDYTPVSHYRERILPSGTIELVINLHDDELRIYDSASLRRRRRFPGAIISGTYAGPFVSDTAEERAVLGVHFKPAGAFPFLGAPASEFADTHLDLEAIWGRSARDLREQLCEPHMPEERFRILEEAFSTHLYRPMERHYAVRAALEEFARPAKGARVRELAKKIGLSQRRLIEVFACQSGLTPKVFDRLQRFHRAAAMISESSEPPDWAELSLRGGYFDQAHMIADFAEFSGLTPMAYFRELQKLDAAKIHRKRNHLPVAS